MAFVVELPEESPRSVLPAGGSPTDDRAYLAWRETVLARAADRHWLRHWHGGADAAPGLDAAGLDEYLAGRLRLRLPLFGDADPVTYAHKVRFLAVCLRDRRADVEAAAERFVAEVAGS